MSAFIDRMTLRPRTNSRIARLRAAFLAGLLLAAGGERAFAAGSICRQDCARGPCSQTLCGPAGPTGGYSHCAGGSQAWDGGTYSSWCLSWGQPLSTNVATATVPNAGGNSVSQPTTVAPIVVLAEGSMTCGG